MPPTPRGIEPKPPRTAAVNPLMATRPIFDDRKTTGAIRTPRPRPRRRRGSTTRSRRARRCPHEPRARWFCARRASRAQPRPAEQRGQRQHQASAAPIDPSDTGATRTGPTARGRLEKNPREREIVVVQATRQRSAASATAERDDQHVEVVAEIAWRMTTRSRSTEERRRDDRDEQRDDERQVEDLERRPATNVESTASRPGAKLACAWPCR